MSGVNAVDTKRMDRNRKKGKGIEHGICTQRMRGRARERKRERERAREKEQERDRTQAQTYRDACSIRRMDNLDEG